MACFYLVKKSPTNVDFFLFEVGFFWFLTLIDVMGLVMIPILLTILSLGKLKIFY